MSDNIQLGDDIIDSREIIATMEELESEIEDLEEEVEEIDESLEAINDGVYDKGGGPDRKVLEHQRGQLEIQIEELQDELAIWKEFEDAGAPDWQYGACFIRDEHFVEYAQQLAEDVVEGLNDCQWPYNCIDWEQAARELQVDYTEIDVEDETYWVRA